MFKKLFKRKKVVDVLAPLSGQYKKISEVPDPVFAQKMIGDGAAIHPENGKATVVAPFNGTIKLVAEAKHAIGLEDEHGIELLIHVGIDTVELKGEGFTPLVKVNDRVQAGQPLMEVDFLTIDEKDKPTITPIVVTNNHDQQFQIIHKELDTVVAGKTVLFSVEV